MANVFTLNNLNYTYPGQISQELFFKPSVQTPDFLSIFRVETGIPYKRQLQRVNTLSKIVKTDPGCGTITPSGTADNQNRTLEVSDLFFRIEQCFDAFNEKWMIEQLPLGIDKATLGRFIESMIQQQITDALRRDNFRIFSFSDSNDADADYSQCDGLWRRLIDGEATYEVDKISAITTLSQIADQRALDYLRLMYERAKIILKQLPVNQKKFFVTGNVYENLMTTYEDKALDGGGLTARVEDGVTRLLFRGVEVVPVYAWDLDLEDAANPFNGVFNTAILYTATDNHVVGVGEVGALNGIKQWYENKDRKVYWEGNYRMGYNYVHGDLQAISYGTVS